MSGKTCQNCAWQTGKRRTCPIAQRLHEPNFNAKAWSLNRTNFGCIFWVEIGTQVEGSVLDQLDHTRRYEVIKEHMRGQNDNSDN